MKTVGLFLLVAGWGIVLCAIVLFPHALPRIAFITAGMCLEAFGLMLTFRANTQPGREPE